MKLAENVIHALCQSFNTKPLRVFKLIAKFLKGTGIFFFFKQYFVFQAYINFYMENRYFIQNVSICGNLKANEFTAVFVSLLHDHRLSEFIMFLHKEECSSV